MNSAIYQTAMDIQSAAAKTAMAYFRNGVAVELKSDKSPVSEADLKIERDARDLILSRFPDHQILGEEYGSGDLDHDHVWVIDPIDGTRSFISGNPSFGFLLSYFERGVNKLSMVGMPALSEVYVGQAAGIATLNGTAIRASGQTQLDQAIVYVNEGEKLLADAPGLIPTLAQSCHTFRLAYDCYPHAMLAAGFLDCVVDYDLKPFDFLPVSGVLEAAGAVVTDWDGKPLHFGSDGRIVSAATPELHAQVLEKIAALG